MKLNVDRRLLYELQDMPTTMASTMATFGMVVTATATMALKTAAATTTATTTTTERTPTIAGTAATVAATVTEAATISMPSATPSSSFSGSSIFTEAIQMAVDHHNGSALSPSVVSAFAYDIYAPDSSQYWNDGGGGGELPLATSPGINNGLFYGGSSNNNNVNASIDHTMGGFDCQSFDFNTNLSYWNLTCDAREYAVPLYGYGMPFLTIITIIANSLIVLVLSKKNMATPTNFVLMVMAVCDMLTVIFPAPGLFYMYTLGNHNQPLNPVALCQAFNIFNEIMPTICHTASIWLTLALAVQRYIYVCHAPMARTWCTMPRVRRCTLYITIAAILHQSTRFCDRTYYELQIEWNGQWAKVYHIMTAAWVHDWIGEDLYFTCYYGFRVLFVNFLPCIILVTLNILLFRAMRQAQERRKLLFRENRKKECKKLRDSNCTTLMLIVVVTVFLIVEIPIAVLTVLHIVSSLIVSFLDYRFANIFITFTNFLLVVSYPINFGIYCGMSRQFRETFKEIFLRRLVRKTDHSSKYSIVNGPRTACTNTNETVL